MERSDIHRGFFDDADADGEDRKTKKGSSGIASV